jgi:flavorubredoxin
MLGLRNLSHPQFHTGARSLFPAVKQSIEKVLPVSRLRYIGFSHYEQDKR